ncbi:DUF3618 domain-containing protein [Mycolicibacterium mengxianglii]|uniref:DUF3618 domain-containing protein n=1 Tax=Mycolicibacterium mengxianglii TaxID=2736649 RepID=UPI0027DA686D|nr:DUF3618 domain-containing protein [Mycolicibacterium mengxianglii]
MDSTNGAAPEPGSDAGIDELQADIERTRDELGKTVGALADKADVKARAQEKVAVTKDAAVEKIHIAQATVQRNPRIDVAVVVAVVIGIVIWARRRKTT